MDWRSLPPLSALRAFAAFAEAGNVVDAGVALGVSHAAISQQLRTLETHLDVALLDRTGRALRLTAAGDQLANALRAGFAAMIQAAQEATGARDARALQISATPTFAASWLMPRLPRFRALHPDIDLMLNPTPQIVTLSADGIDVAIRYGAGPFAGLEAEPLLQSPMVVVAAPSLVGDAPITSPEDLRAFPWLEEFGTTESSNWLRRQGVGGGIAKGLMQVPGNLLLDGARDGQGIAVTIRAFVEPDLQAGRLKLLFTEDRPDAGYHIVTRSGVPRQALRDFLRWLRRERDADGGADAARA
ncbi:LysR family transcriptional regulator [Sulfitobacter sabulilitoris]|uniref:LysR family transcriptional regulator n=1 Tax=Sulfitobacter sabulilitoris TaxID=2562655 RepID=A0A5S3PFS3_9RHOB|nr:LysR family transcriptional regulator [Sulfitobacter sabulilitoris]TMM52904.1 LysR family transcriptional regulator [Sulfitobacter sabulilitoris]